MEQKNIDTRTLALKLFFRKYLDLRKVKDDEQQVYDSIQNGLEYRGVNIWILIIAMLIASLGLTVNSTAVIIGAMLISPLMGPIIGIGFSVGTSDFELLKRSFRTYLILTVFSVASSTVYFLISPVAEGQSELLARTSPTIYDVFIALFGGFGGFIALSTKEKGNVLPGVAIATALMPPLCTAGYGLATGNLVYFLGAFYLYFINSVFICLATYFGCKVLSFRKKEMVDPVREKKLRKYMFVLAVLAMLPAIYLTVNIFRDTFFESEANRFIRDQLSFENTQVVNKRVTRSGKGNEIRLVLVGQEVPDSTLAVVRNNMKGYRLDNTRLVILQGVSGQAAVDISSIRSSVMENLYQASGQQLAAQAQQIDSLKNLLRLYRGLNEQAPAIMPELRVLYPDVKSLAMSRTLRQVADSARQDTVTLAVVKLGKKLSNADRAKMAEWLKARTRSKNLELITE